MNSNNKNLINETWNNNGIKTEPIDDEWDGIIEPENIIIKTEIPSTPIINELKLKNEFNNPVILSTNQVIIKEELNIIDEEIYDENWDNTPENDPLSVETDALEKFSCEICAQKFTQTRHLKNHLFVMHRPLTVAGTGAFCNKCHKWFTELKYPSHNPCFNYMRNIQNGKKVHSCDICDKDFTAISLLKEHLLEYHRPLVDHKNFNLSKAIIKRTVCKICDAVFSTENSLFYHLTVMHRPYSICGTGAYCTRCQVWLPEKRFKDHRPCVARQQAVTSAFCCYICDTQFQMLHLLKAHVYFMHRPLSLQTCSDAFCDKCNRWFKEDNYMMHRCFRRAAIKFTNGLVFKCAICSKECDSEAYMKKHLYRVHRPLNVAAANTTQVFCDFCNEYWDEDKFEAHVPCHSVDSKCVFCLILMPSKEHYLHHDFTWTKWRSYQCNLCNLNTQNMRLADLNKHMMGHGKKSVFRCVKCKFDFANTENTEAHIECMHSGCRCVVEPCVCHTYNYDYYYEFVKQRNVSDFRGNSKYLLENEIDKIRDEQYNAIEANIDVWHMRKEDVDADDEDGDVINIDFQIDCNQFQPVDINKMLMPSTSTSIPGTSNMVDDPQFRTNSRMQEVTPKSEDDDILLTEESPSEKRRRLHGKSEKRRNQRRESRLKKGKQIKGEPTFDFVNIEEAPDEIIIPSTTATTTTTTTTATIFIPEIEKESKHKTNKYMRNKQGDNEKHEIFLARRRVYMQNYRRLKRQQPNTEEENEEEAAEKRARINEKIRQQRYRREARMSREELLQRRAVKAEKVRLRRQLQREQLSEEELSQIRAIEAERKRMKRRQLSKEQKQREQMLNAAKTPNQLSEDDIVIVKCEKTDDDSSCLTNDEDQIVEQLRIEQLKELNNY